MATLAKSSPLEKWVGAEMKVRHIPGIAIGVYKDGKPLEIVTKGYADVARKNPVGRDTQFEICSITKQFTAAAILLLAQDEKLDLDDKISKYVPGIPAGWSGVTLRRLLNHTSGVPDRIFVDHLSSMTRSSAVRKLVDHRLEFAPGKRWSYNNTGYWLAGLAIEKVSGLGYYEFLHERIFKPLGMKHTIPNRPSSTIKGKARGYKYSNGKYVRGNPLSAEVGYAAGGLASTIDDLNIWSQALTSNSILNAKSRKQMLTAGNLTNGVPAWNFAGGGYGLGVFVGGSTKHPVEKHSGGWDDASCQLARFPRDGLTVVMLTNVGQYEQRSYCGERIANLFNSEIAPPTFAATKTASPACTPPVRGVLEKLASHSRLSRSALSVVCRQKLLSDMHRIQDLMQGKPLSKFEFVLEIPQADATIYLFRATFGHPLIVQAAIDAKEKIVELQVFEPPTP